MQLTLRLHFDEALALQKREPPSPALQKLALLLDEMGVKLTPVHPGATDPLLAPYFTVDVEDEAAIDELIGRLRDFPIIEAAYLKPPDAAPSG